MIRIKTTLTLMATLLILGLNPEVYAGDMKGDWPHDKSKMGAEGFDGDADGHMGVEMRLERMKKHLELNEQQVTKLRDIFERSDAQMKSLREKKMANRKNIADLMKKGGNDQVALENAAKTAGDIEAQTVMQFIKTQTEMYNTLDAKQQDKLKQWHTKSGEGKHWQ